MYCTQSALVVLHSRLIENWDGLVARLTQGGCQPTSTLSGMDRLTFSELLLEIEALRLNRLVFQLGQRRLNQ